MGSLPTDWFRLSRALFSEGKIPFVFLCSQRQLNEAIDCVTNLVYTDDEYDPRNQERLGFFAVITACSVGDVRADNLPTIDLTYGMYRVTLNVIVKLSLLLTKWLVLFIVLRWI